MNEEMLPTAATAGKWRQCSQGLNDGSKWFKNDTSVTVNNIVKYNMKNKLTALQDFKNAFKAFLQPL